ncbi:exodeoxyribonuclease VII small subunit [Porphyrobacter sp. YT40]|uniref:exodeoxyribonuclease VII small subunit n=1 Tax=Porphyrobacter sp. YT40 TaxID=2547601 RepID=UPI00114479D2|nr:exodeoxyribonuclease VII small subunit [Porphyrobacter sp. YT40]QDH35061.1 exodeoxyribonuclease VII small subunit [Porphyrobacter sp. YT40]
MDKGTSSPAAAGQDIAQLSFEQALGQLEQIVQQLERGDVPLDQSISLYERGEALRAACQQRLDAAQARIEKIVTGADGRASGTRPFDAEG